MTYNPWALAAIVASTLAVSLLLFTLLWLIHVVRRDAGVADWGWGAGFAAIAWICALAAPRSSFLHVFVMAAVSLWALRLTAYLALRGRAKGAEDSRYAAMRAKGGAGWPRRALATVFWPQALVQWLLSLPIQIALLAPGASLSPSGVAIAAAGAALFGIGFALEMLADWQLARFKARPGASGRLMTSGLWAWSRHPNYFGESVLWWGLGLATVALTGVWWLLAAPLALTGLLLQVSGIPPLEAELASRPGWAAYAARTSAFVPWPPRTK